MCIIGSQGARCVTCKKLNCKHVRHLQKIIEDTESYEELSTRLQIFANHKAEKTRSHTTIVKTMSEVTIPLSMPQNLKNLMKVDYSRRFNLCDGVAKLMPSSTLRVCSFCASTDCWSKEVYPAGNIFLVTPQCCYPAQGSLSIFSLHYYYAIIIGISVFTRRCTTNNCMGKLTYDGLEDGVLNMGIFCISHEVLRDYMFHFLYGR